MKAGNNLIFTLGGVILGLLLGIQIAMQNPGKFRTEDGSKEPPIAFQIFPDEDHQQVTQSKPEAQPVQEMAGEKQGKPKLPQGHVPVDAIQKKLADLNEILRKEPKNQSAIISMANLMADSGDLKKAAEWYQKAVDQDPGNVSLITDLGTCFLQMQEFDRAMTLYKKSLSISPDHYQTLVNFGIANMAIGNKKAAADAWEKLTILYPKDPKIEMIKKAVTELRASS